MAIVVMVIMLAVLPLQALAMTEVSVELPFVVENVKGTVIIEAVDSAPLPEVTEFRDVSEGMFVISYTQPDTHHYRIYQQIPETNTNDVIHDTTVYNVTVFVLSDDDGNLHTAFTISIDGNVEKQESVIFENKTPDETTSQDTTSENTTLPSTTSQNTTSQDSHPQTGDTSNLGLWLILSVISLAGILILLFARRREKDK